MLPKTCSKVIVWDFDGVLFNAAKFRRDNEKFFRKEGVPAGLIESEYQKKKERGGFFSISWVATMLQRKGYKISEEKIRKDFYQRLSSGAYAPKDIDRVLRRLKKKRFCHLILSLGSTPFQYKKINTGYGKFFKRHFSKIKITPKPKWVFLKKIQKKNPDLRIFLSMIQKKILFVRGKIYVV